MKRVAVCIPSGDMVHADFAMSLAGMAYRCSPIMQDGVKYEAISLAIINTKGSLVVNNRNKLVAEAQNLGVDYLFFVDSDIVIHPWTLRRLIEHDKDIVGATYIQREEPHRLLGKSLSGVMLDEALTGVELGADQVMEVGALPSGCLLIKIGVFSGMEKPYFQTPAHAATDSTPEWIEGEDYFFCRQAREQGFSIWLDLATSFALGHVGQRVNTIPTMQQEPENKIALIH